MEVNQKRMKNVKWFLIVCMLVSFMTGCSPDVIEISDITLVMAVGIDYDMEKNKYVLTAYCVLPSSASTEKSGKLSAWVASATGTSIYDAAKNLRNQASKKMIWQHNKFIIVGESAARHSFYDIVDFLTRNRQVRITSNLMVSDGKAADKLKVKSETGDLLSNELLGKTRNEMDWGKSINQTVKNIANWNSNPYRGFVAGRLKKSKLSNNSHEVLVSGGGSVFDKGRFIDWLEGEEVLVVHLLSQKRQWKDLEFIETVDFKSTKVTLLFQVAKQAISSSLSDGSPKLDIYLNFKANLSETNHRLTINKQHNLVELEQAASTHMENIIRNSLNRFQKELKVDLTGFSDYFIQFHPIEWKKMKNEWMDIYPTIPINVHVDVKIDTLGMIQSIGGK